MQAVQSGLVGAGRLERGDPALRAGRRHRRTQPIFLFTEPDRAPDRADRRPQSPGREERRRSATSGSTSAGIRSQRERRRARATASCIARPARGLRYYVKEGDRRVVSDRRHRGVKAHGDGRDVDPSYAFPLPIFGINYLDFRSSAARTRSSRCCLRACSRRATCSGRRSARSALDASVDFFAIAVPSSDRVYRPDGERSDDAAC